MTGFIRTEQVRILRETHYDVFQRVYKAARELREDLTVLHNLYADPKKSMSPPSLFRMIWKPS